MHPTTLIIGLGQTGLSVARFLARTHQPFIVFDTRAHPSQLALLKKECPKAKIYLEVLPDSLWESIDHIVLSPGLPLQHTLLSPAKEKDIPIIGDVELFVRHCQAPIIAITGTNGKSTVTALVERMAKQAGIHVIAGGNIGLPVLELLNQPDADLYVLELSSFQLETLQSLHNHIACILNVSPDHLDHHPNFDAYLAAKHRIFKNASLCIFNRDDPSTQPNKASQQLSFGLSLPSGTDEWGCDQHQLMCGPKQWLPIDELPFHDHQFIQNALAALAIGSAFGLPKAAMLDALKSFQGLAHRNQWIGDFNGVAWYNDSKATNVGATLSAIQALRTKCQGKLILIAGGDAKGADLQPLQVPVQAYVSQMIVLGKDAGKLKSMLADCTAITQVQDLKEAVQRAQKMAIPGDIVLLSPACASWDMFENYIDRGDQFMALTDKIH